MHRNNFDFLRLIFALSVIITHSFPLTGLNEWEHDLLSELTRGQATFSYIGVRGFFTISGFLIYQSLVRSSSLGNYFWKRILRLFPALVVVLLATIILGVFVYPGDAQTYFNNKSVSSYFTNNITLFKLQYGIDGVFQDNPSKAINGSLWTIPYEFFFYVMIGLLWFARKMQVKYLVMFGFIYLLTAFFARESKVFTFLYLDSKYIIELGIFFIAGSLMAALNIDKYPKRDLILFTGLLLLFLSIRFSNFYIFQFFALPMVIIPIGLASTVFIRDIGTRLGDLSYGIYIMGYPVQQTLIHYFKLDAMQLMLIAVPVTFVLAYLSWHIVEKRALRLKDMRLSFHLKRGNQNENRDVERTFIGKGRE